MISSFTMMIYSKNTKLTLSKKLLLKGTAFNSIPIVFSTLIFKERLISVSYQNVNDDSSTLFASADYSLSNDGLTLTIDNNAKLTFDTIGDNKIIIKLKTIGVPIELTYVIQVFTYPTKVDFAYPIFFYETSQSFMKITLDAKVADPSIFTTIKTVCATATKFSLGDMISSAPGPAARYEYKLHLANCELPTNWKKYSDGISFTDQSDAPLPNLVTVSKS